MKTLVIDQMGHQVLAPAIPKRIVSLVPSQTELLFDLCLSDRIVGVTKFCIYPAEKVKTKTIIGGTKNFHFELIHQLQPDLIIGNKEENYQEGILELQKWYPVWMSDIYNLQDAYKAIKQIGQVTDTVPAAKKILDNIQRGFNQLRPQANIPAAYFIWRKPYMSIGSQTFIQDILAKAGFHNIFGHLSRYPAIQAVELKTANPKVILLSSEPYPFSQKHIKEFQEICPEAIIKLVDGEMFCWYGSRLQYAAAYLDNLRKEIEKLL
nr:helical backbone metal receptor [Adhaeribacter aquaticus]